MHKSLILRGVTLAGIDSVMCPQALRTEAWARLAQDLDLNKLEPFLSTIPLEDVPRTAKELLAGKVTGRVVVDVNR